MHPPVNVPLSRDRQMITSQQNIQIAPRLVLLFVMILAIWMSLAPAASAPAVVPASAPASEFSAERAMRDLAVVAAAPHPVGSPRQFAVRDYLIEQIRALGLTPEIQSTSVNRVTNLGVVEATAVENVLVRVPGTDSSRAILVEGHYDSVPTTGGAADCGSCAVTALEALRAIVAGPPLKNDVIFMFADAEEVYIAGARAFMEQHPWAADIGLSLVFEGYGTAGGSILDVTSPASGWWVDQALRAAPHPLAYSLFNDLMWLTGGSSSDMDAFIPDGQAGFSFVYFTPDTAPAYHSTLDSVQNLDPRSLQHHGSYAVSLARHFGNLDLANAPRLANQVYFPLLPGVVVHYPGTWAMPLSIVALLVFVAVAGLGLSRQRLSIGGVLAGVVVFLLSLVAAIVVVTMVWALLLRANTNLQLFQPGGRYGVTLYLLTFLALILAIVGGLYLLWRRWIRQENLFIGALVWWALFAVLSAQGLPGFSYLFAWPLLFACLALGWSYLQPEQAQRPWLQAAAFIFPALAGLVLLAWPILFLHMFSSRIEMFMGLPLAALSTPFIVLLIGLLLPQIEFLTVSYRRWLPIGAGLAFLVLLALSTFSTGFDERHPKPNTALYWLDADSSKAEWIMVSDSASGQVELDDWTRQFFPNGDEPGTFNPWPNGWMNRPYPARRGSAPLINLSSSTFGVSADSTSGGERRLSLHMTLPEDVLSAQLFIDASGPLRALTVNGGSIDIGKTKAQPVQITLNGRHSDGVDLDIVAPEGSINIVVQDRRYGLPEIPGFTIVPRPASMMVMPFNDVADSTFVRKSFDF